MQYRQLGRTGLEISIVGLGCSSLGGGVFLRNDGQALRLLHGAHERGVTFYDTADSYGYGHSESLLGRAFKGRRQEVVIASKVGFLPSSLARVGRFARHVVGPVRPLLRPWERPLRRVSRRRHDFSRHHITRAIAGSLRRLQTDYLDVYLLHNPSAMVLEDGTAFEALENLRRAGAIRWYGASAHTVDDALLALRWPGLSVLEVALNALEPEAAERLLPAAARQGVGIIARIPLARGLLTDKAAIVTGFFDGSEQALRQRRRVLEAAARAHGRPINHLALQFVLQHAAVSTVIPGTRSVDHLEDNLRALEAPPLTPGEMARIMDAVPPDCAVAPRRNP